MLISSFSVQSGLCNLLHSPQYRRPHTSSKGLSGAEEQSLPKSEGRVCLLTASLLVFRLLLAPVGACQDGCNHDVATAHQLIRDIAERALSHAEAKLATERAFSVTSPGVCTLVGTQLHFTATALSSGGKIIIKQNRELSIGQSFLGSIPIRIVPLRWETFGSFHPKLHSWLFLFLRHTPLVREDLLKGNCLGPVLATSPNASHASCHVRR